MVHVPDQRLEPPEDDSFVPRCYWCQEDVADETVYKYDSEWYCEKCFLELLLDDFDAEEIADAFDIEHKNGSLLADDEDD